MDWTDRVWRLLCQLALMWALAMIVLVFSGLIGLLPGWALGLLVGAGLVGMLLRGVAWWAAWPLGGGTSSSTSPRSGHEQPRA